MRLHVRHTTTYDYSEPVFLEPHNLHLAPLQRSYFFLEDFKVTISPTPAGQADVLDLFDNPTQQAWFDGLHERLTVTSEMTVKTVGFNPFKFLQYPLTGLNANDIYGKEMATILQPFLHFDHNSITQEIHSLLTQLSKESDYDILKFIRVLLEYIYKGWDHEVRAHANVWSPSYCYEQKKGSCRDLAWMMINMLRSVGLASRFVSGYSFNPDLAEGHELHAWLEVLIPGGGWIGVDPGLGLFVTQHFVPLAVGSEPRYTMPVMGAYRGGAQASLTSVVEMTSLEA